MRRRGIERRLERLEGVVRGHSCPECGADLEVEGPVKFTILTESGLRPDSTREGEEPPSRECSVCGSGRLFTFDLQAVSGGVDFTRGEGGVR